MSTIGIFLLTDPQHVDSLPYITERLLKHCNPSPQHRRWHLDYRLLRSTAAPPSADDKTQQRFQDVLYLSYHPQKAYVAVDSHGPSKPSPANEKPGKTGFGASPGTADTVIAIPAQQRDQFYGLITAKMGALWTPRMMMHVQNGQAFDAGDYIVKMGELKQPGGQQVVRGVLVCIQSNHHSAGADEVKAEDSTAQEQDASTKASRQDEMRDFWKKFGIVEGAKEAFCTSQPGDDGYAEVRALVQCLATTNLRR